MIYSRRDLTLLSAGLIAAAASGQKTTLPSRAYLFEDLEVKGTPDNHSRPVFGGLTHSGFHVDLHETELAPGMAPHAPHHHEHEEMMMIPEGTLEVTISGKATQVGPGSVVYVASNEEHGLRSVGKNRAHYFVIALGRA